MKKSLFILLFISFSFNAFPNSRFQDSIFTTKVNSSGRKPSSVSIGDTNNYCIVKESSQVLNNLCYSTKNLCVERANFWKVAPGFKNITCVKS
ncbi:MAG: hypothetical protein H8E98_06475 [Bacteroidetes bacterium]|nr:hypothetical protein [Bacteroidota bacterium]